MIHARNLTLALRDGQRTVPVLQNINLDIRSGEWVGLTGSNGSGKSSLIRTLSGLIVPSGGSLTAFGMDLSSPASRRHIKQRIQSVFQNPEAQTVGSTPEEDVAFGLENRGLPRDEMIDRTREALRRTGLAHKASVPVEELSGGERQRLAISSCLALEPDMLIFDEATSMLDPLSRRSIVELARELWRGGVSVLWVTQRMEELTEGTRVMVLDQGKLVYDGEPRTLFYASGLPASLGWEVPPVVGIGRVMQSGGWPLEKLPLTEQELEVALCRSS